MTAAEHFSPRAEGIAIDDIHFADNMDILELIQGKEGLMVKLDQELAVPKATDRTFVAKCTKAFGKEGANSCRYIAERHADAIDFAPVHYAGNVKYNAEGWLQKNQDTPPVEALELFCSSSNSILQSVGQDMQEQSAAAAAGGGAGGGRGRKKKTVGSAFRESLSVLMRNIESSQPHFIR